MLRRALEFVDADKLIPSFNCGTAPLARGTALDKLCALSAGADIVRPELASVAVPVCARTSKDRFLRRRDTG